MQPLLDSDVLRYEVGFAAEAGWQQEGVPPFDYVAQLLDERIANICAIVGATAPPILYLTEGNNFRNEIAKRQPYKQRAGHKPYHFKNLTAYMKGTYDVRTRLGFEADDLMAMEQTARGESTIICTRDKDLFSVSGWIYSWELGNQPSFGPELISQPGHLYLSGDRKKIRGYGLLFFLAQCLTGDAVDSVPGLPKCGPVKAFEILKDVKSYEEGVYAVLSEYRKVFGEHAEEELLEQGRLLWMTRETIRDCPVLWNFPWIEYKEIFCADTKTIERVV